MITAKELIEYVLLLIIFQVSDIRSNLYKSTWFSIPTIHIVSFLFGIILVFFIYLAVYLPYIKHDTREWNLVCPNVLYGMSFTMILFVISALCCFWKIWGFFTPFIMLLITLTLVDFFSHFYPVF